MSSGPCGLDVESCNRGGKCKGCDQLPWREGEVAEYDRGFADGLREAAAILKRERRETLNNVKPQALAFTVAHTLKKVTRQLLRKANERCK